MASALTMPLQEDVLSFWGLITAKLHYMLHPIILKSRMKEKMSTIKTGTRIVKSSLGKFSMWSL